MTGLSTLSVCFYHVPYAFKVNLHHAETTVCRTGTFMEVVKRKRNNSEKQLYFDN